jgi:hypothetical protein
MKKTIIQLAGLLAVFHLQAQVPVASFSINPNPACSQSMVQITDLSSNATSWLYTFMGQGPGGNTTTVQNPTVAFNAPGVYTISLVASNASGASSPAVQTLTVHPSPNGQVNPQQVSTCPGSSPITLNALAIGPGGGPGTTFNWSTGSTTKSISVSPTVTTTYSVIMTGTNGCSIQRTVTITITAATVAIVGLPAALCPGSSSTLSAMAMQPGPFSYSWSTGASTRTISTNVPGNYSVTVVNSNGCAATQAYSLGTSSTLSLNAITIPGVLCAGGTGTVRATGATSYTWSNGSTTPNATVAPNGNTTYSVYGEFGTCSGTASVLFSVNVIPTITAVSNPPAICPGGTATLTASGASTYTWIPLNVAPSITVAPAGTTNYIVGGTNPGCQVRTATVTVIVAADPVVSVSSSQSLICAGEPVALAASGASTFNWSTGATVAVILVTPGSTTTYSVTGFSTDNCSATAVFTQSVSACEGILLNAIPASLSVYPNPNTGHFTITTSATSKVIIINQLGQEIGSYESNGNQVEVSDLVPGIYFISLEGSRQFLKVAVSN